MKAIIIDDEPYCVDVLAVLLNEYCPEVQVIGRYTDPVQGLEAILKTPPQLLFLDIEMPILNGFDLLKKCDDLAFHVIFTTAYDKYAVRAFRFSALDYLLKPIDQEELQAAVQRAVGMPRISKQQLDLLQQNRVNPTPERIALPTAEAMIFTEVKDIIHCDSDGSYTTFFVKNEKGNCDKILVSKSLREIEELLNNPDFFRTHQSHLINLRHIKKYIRTFGDEVVMSDGQHIPIARSKKNEFMGLVQKL